MRNRTTDQKKLRHCFVLECGYDYLGRRYMKRVTRNGVVTKHERYIYRGYLQIAALDLRREAHPALWYVLWDPTEPVATRPLAIQKDGTWYTYGHDLTKNVWELYKTNGTIATVYNYAPFGSVTANGTAEQPFQWSSEFYDAELGMVYYNFRFYNPLDGRWISRDPIGERGGIALYGYVANQALSMTDVLGTQGKKKCCKCGTHKMSQRQYCENGVVKSRQRKTTTIFMGHCNGDLPEMAQKDKTSLSIGMVTCFANSTLENNVDQARRLEHERPRGNDLMPMAESLEALDEEIEAMKKKAEDICKEQGAQIWKIEIVVQATDKDGKKMLNKKYPGAGERKRVGSVICDSPSCEKRGGQMQ